eukprot:11351889-Prorocentrum_lima.AAC.1
MLAADAAFAANQAVNTGVNDAATAGVSAAATTGVCLEPRGAHNKNANDPALRARGELCKGPCLREGCGPAGRLTSRLP